ncbi:hypothetical protein JCM10914A_29120 [Paenibacillus sp. JCM 10914]|uniref:S-layer homology domain-containing protein n=1 Tax=Paenibacillus sp. JCM 10914 TaxID=1236974 RepID=UPI0003CC4BCF|nr:S-layer homology domain-containing protein [Paenibacillus sp. JCM 10914]GAE08446.1 hypothetical protein JCM10914_4743 [Paenibacillus sp. JCM 10914]
MKLKSMMSKLLSSALSVALVASIFAQTASPAAAATGETVKVWLTTGDKNHLLTPQNDTAFQPDTNPMEHTINVDEEVQYQTIDGFGASLTDSSAWLLFTKLDAGKREEVMRKLFDPEEGVGLSYIRIPMGASDFALDKYTYNDLPEGQTDENLEHFSIAYDLDYIIPVLKQALEINPDLKFMGSPWSAPAWMKTTGSLMKGKLKEEYYGVYAQYFVKFIEAYKQEGIEIDAVTLQNEPQYEPATYSGMKMDPEDQAAFVKELGPALEEANLSTKIIIWDHNWDDPAYPIEVLNDVDAYPYIDGTAFHGYAGIVDNQSLVHDPFPDKGIYFTESSGGQFAPNFSDNLVWDLQNLIIGATRHWAKTSLKWNLALDENHGPFVGGCGDCRGVVTVNQATKEVTYNEEYYSFGHASKFVKPGAVRIKSNSFDGGGIENVAFLNPDGSKALIVLNPAKSEREFKVRSGNESFVYSLPAGAVATFTWNGTPGSNGPDMLTPYSRVEAEDYDPQGSTGGVTATIVTDTGGGKSVSLADQGYLAYPNVEFVDGTASVKLRVAAEQEARIEFRLGSPNGQLVGIADLSPTGGLQNWTTQAAAVEGASGVHTLYLVMNGPVHLNWFQFSQTSYLDTMNYIGMNGGFEQGDLTGWRDWNSKGTAHKVEAGGARSGEYKLNHWFSEGYEQYTYRTVKVPNGTYRASVWVNKADNIRSKLEVKNYGGPDMAADMGEMYSDWKQVTLENIRVTNGQLEIGVSSSTSRSEWANYDDFELYRVTTKAPAKPVGPNPPSEPQTVTSAVYDGHNIQLDWSPVQEAAGYKVYRSLKDLANATVTGDVYVDFAEVSVLDGAVTTFTDTGLQGDTTYHYAVSAFNENGESAVSRSVSGTTEAGQDQVPPAAPQGLRAEAGIEQVKLYWEPNVERDFAKYHIYRNDVLIGSINTILQTQYTARGLTPGEKYIFAVTAVDKAGNESPYSETVTASPNASGLPLSFANLDFELGSLEGWSEWHPEDQTTANFVDNDNPRGSYKLTHWSGDDYQQSTYRILELPNGTYKVQVWARTGGGQNMFQLEVKNYGGDALSRDMKSASGGTWTPFSIDQIQVTNGQMEIAVFSDAKGGNWAGIDDFEIYSYAPAVPAGLAGIGGDGKAYLQWNANTEFDLAAYHIYQDGQKVSTVPADGGKRSAEVTGLTNGQSYSFAVSAVDTDDNESFPSTVQSITPVVPVNLKNPGFEDEDKLNGWQGWSNIGNAQFVDDGDPRSGVYKLTHWADQDYQQTTYQSVKVDNGWYQASVWARVGDDVNVLRMEIKKHGGEDVQVDMKSASSSEYTLFISEPFQVTTGDVELGLFSDNQAGNWSAFDDVQIVPVMKKEPNPDDDNGSESPPGAGNGETAPGSNNGGSHPSPPTTAPELTAKDGVVEVKLGSGQHQIALPANAPALDGDNQLRVQGEQVALIVPAKVLQALKALLPGQDLSQAQLVFELGKPEADQAKKLVDQAAGSVKANLAVASEMLALSMKAISKEGTEYRLSEWPEPVRIEWLGVRQPAEGILGAYVISASGQLTYAGGVLNGNIFTVPIDRLDGNVVLLSFDKRYSDVGRSHWAYEAIQQLSARLLVNGISDARFAPQAQITRAEFAALIARAMDLRPVATVAFIDVDETKWYAEAIQAVHAAGIVSGRDGNRFVPDAVISRQEMAMMLVKAYERRQGTVPAVSGVSAFVDEAQISAWAKASVLTAAELGLIQGKGSDRFDPQGAASRAESVQVIARLLGNLK